MLDKADEELSDSGVISAPLLPYCYPIWTLELAE
jgi:hypothetical protein